MGTEDYENACKSCQEANRYLTNFVNDSDYTQLDCKKYGCKDTKTDKPVQKHDETSEQNHTPYPEPEQDIYPEPYHNFSLITAIIITAIILSLIVVWYGKFR